MLLSVRNRPPFFVQSRQVEPRPANPHGAAVHPGPPVRPQPRRPPGQRRRRAVEGQRGRGHQERQGVDQDVRHGKLRRERREQGREKITTKKKRERMPGEEEKRMRTR